MPFGPINWGGGGGGGGTLTSVTGNSAGVSAATVGGAVTLANSVNAIADSANWLSRVSWFCDPSNISGTASDGNTGANAGQQLLTMNEVAKRLRGARPQPGSPILIAQSSNMLAGQGAHFADIRGVGTPGGTVVNPFSANSWLMIVGIPTASYTGTITAPHQPGALPFNDRNTITDAAAPVFAFALLKRTNGTVGYTWRLKDETGGVWRTSQWMSGNAQATIAANDTYQIMTLPILRNVTFDATLDVNQNLIALIDEQSTAVVNRPNAVRWVCCSFGATSPVLNGAQLINCGNLVNRFASSNQGGSMTEIRGGGQIGNLTLPGGVSVSMAPGGSVLYFTLQAGAILGGGYNKLASAALAFNDLATPMIDVQDSNQDYTIQAIGGFGNTGRIIRIGGVGNRVCLSSGQTRTMTTDATPYEVTTSAVTSGNPLIIDMAAGGNVLVNGQV